jgi:hypothetical protein
MPGAAFAEGLTTMPYEEANLVRKPRLRPEMVGVVDVLNQIRIAAEARGHDAALRVIGAIALTIVEKAGRGSAVPPLTD